MQWDVDTSAYVDTGVDAYGRPATFTATATTLSAGSAATASISGTPTAPVLNLGIPRGADGAVMSVNGKTGAVQLNDEDIPSSAVSGETDVEGALSSLSEQIENLIQESAFTIEIEDDDFVLYWHGASGECPYSVALDGTDYYLIFTYTT